MEEPKKKSRFSAPAKLIAVAAASIVLGIGLCSAGGFNFEGASSTTANIGTFAFFGGLLALAIGVLWWFIALIAGAGK
jgi:hypothetical protein